MSKLYVILGLVWFLIGMTLGQVMGASGDHTQMPTHAHIMLVGGALSILWGILYRLYAPAAGMLGWIQFGLHQLGTLIMVSMLYRLYGGFAPEAEVGPVIAVGAGIVMLGTALMLWIVLRARTVS